MDGGIIARPSSWSNQKLLLPASLVVVVIIVVVVILIGRLSLQL